MQASILVEQGLMTERTIAVVGGFDLHRRCGGSLFGGRYKVVHARNIPRIQSTIYSIFPAKPTFIFPDAVRLQASWVRGTASGYNFYCGVAGT